ncbi:calpain-6 isoform X2 [Bombina bombina]|nr:calpain-6 isoform X2 [Bombina bombina]XP_053555290.1 calpain-6 isoform X2 [Bombina bombina]XP_053555291.1 calpain-6 isoform X2 [Bombina bombina]XP_053555292.1 calpain-6 isoform X2 [Bombina bombina]XP_053555293.1 calpain-6 isoform X2 [Bombina bombina]XP_053555294.1 calpain-6 isoform X2 [Bombina bombina]
MDFSVTFLKNQNYSELKKECMKNGRLFEDPEFPASVESLVYSKAPPPGLEWKRPNELCEDPHLFVDGISSHDLHQGTLGNCWFVAACSCLALRSALWKKVIPNWQNQEWDANRPHKYAGIFHFQFWCLGNWVDVVIDDRLPTVDGNLIYCRSNVKNEFWSALLEKAYAKLAGSYEALEGGNTADAIVDFTGAVTESFDLVKGHHCANVIEQTRMFEILLKVYKRGGLVSCSIKPSVDEDMEAVTPMGLVKGHAYSVTEIKKVPLGTTTLCFGKSEKLFMIRMRNPWGKREWRGAWSDESEEWRKVSKSQKETLGLTVRDDGEFWMTFEDWCTNFTHADVCRIINTSCLSRHKTWEKAEAQGSWTKNSETLLNRSGGCYNNKDTFLQNSQYLFEVRKKEDNVLISLQQKDNRALKKEGRGDYFIIGFEIFKVEQNRKYRIHKLEGQERTAFSTYKNLRSVFLRKRLKSGKYVIIPTTFLPGITSDFVLRLFTDEPSKFSELVHDKPRVTWWSLLFGHPKRVTQVTVHSVIGVQRKGKTRGAGLYIIIKCENQSVKSEVQKNTTSAVFDTQAIFYRKNINKPLAIQVWDSNILSDQFLGQVLLAASPNDPIEVQSLQLHGRLGREAEVMPGCITVKLVSSDDLVEL